MFIHLKSGPGGVESTRHEHPPQLHYVALQSVLGCPQNREFVARARATEVVQGQVKDADAAQTLGTHVARLVASHIRILVAHPHAKVAVLVGQAERVRTESLDGVSHLSQRCILSLQVHVAGVGQLGAHLRPAEKAGGLGLESFDDSLLFRPQWRHPSDSRVLNHLPGTAVSGNSNNHLGGRGLVGQPVLHLEVDVGLRIALVQLVQRVGEVSFLGVTREGLEVEGLQDDKVQVVDDGGNIVVDWEEGIKKPLGDESK